MTEIEIDKALALAIGWKDEPKKMRVSEVFGLQVWIGWWANFGYRDWNVIAPIAARYNCFPFEDAFGRWFSEWESVADKPYYADTPQKAIALAVIGAQHGTKT